MPAQHDSDSQHERRAQLLLRGGMVVDGTGSPGHRGDVAVVGDRIAAVGDLTGWSADVTLDVTGLVVAPGFIDMHTHSDLALLINGRAESKLRQGVTTEVIGMCGFSPAPCPEGRREEIQALFGGWAREVEWTWGSFAQYLEALRDRGTSVNVVPLTGHGILRAGVMGQENRPPTASELDGMRAAVREAVDQGAFGFSSGLVYAPSMFADADELAALAAEMSAAGGIYFSHIRGESETLLDAVAEAVEIGRRGGVAVQIAHMKCEGQAYWGTVAAALDAVERAQQEGVDATFDVYPYTAWNTGLGQLLPAWAREGGPEAVVGRLRDPALRAKVREELAAAAAADEGRWERRLLAGVETDANRALQGMTLAAIAEQRGAAAEDVVMDLLIEESGQASMVGFGMSEEDVRGVLSHRLAMIGSDAAASAPYGVLGEGHPHPRTYGTFARVLGHYARDEGLFPLEEAVAKMTSRPAAKLGLADRGRLAPGLAADIAVFDAGTVADRATYQEPQQYPIGVRYVIVNGVVELDGEENQGRWPGRVLGRQ